MPEDTHEDVRRRLFEAAWNVPAYAPSPGRTVLRARRRAATTIGGGLLAAALAIVVAASSLPIETAERTGGFVREEEDREFLVDVGSGEATEITKIPVMKRAWWLDVSPDGTQLAFTTDSTGSPQVWISDLDGTGLRQLTRGFPDVAEPVWSPDGDEIAFVALGKNGIRNLHVADVATGRSRPITRGSRDTWGPEWSPDGRSILYNVTVAGEALGGEGVFLPNVPGHRIRVAEVGTGTSTTLFGGGNVMAFDGTWTPSGIVFVRGRGLSVAGAERIDLAVLARAGARPLSLHEIGEFAWAPQVSPDGATIAYTEVIRDAEGRERERIFVLDLVTGQARDLHAGSLATWVDADTVLIQLRPM